MEFNAIYVIVAREFKKFIRERSRLVSALARPLVWLFLVSAGLNQLVRPEGGVSYTQFMFPGILGMTILFSSIFSSISINWDKEFGFMKEILVPLIPIQTITFANANDFKLGKGMATYTIIQSHSKTICNQSRYGFGSDRVVF